MRRFFTGGALLSLTPLIAWGQSSPTNQQALDVFSSFDRDLHAALNGLSPILVSYVLGPLHQAAVALLVCVIASEGFRAVTHHQILNVEYLVKGFYLPYGFALVVLKGWNTPIPGLGHSFVGLFTDTSQEIAAYVDLSAMTILFQKFGEIFQALGVPPSIWEDGFVSYWLVVGTMIAVKTIVFVVTSFGFVALAVGSVIGPLFVFFYLFPPTRYLWHSWVGAMIKYSFYFLIAAVVTDIWCVFAVDQIDTTLRGHYDLDHFTALLLSLPVILLAFCFGLFKVPAMANDFTSGSSQAGHGLVGGVIGFVRGALS